MSDSCDRKGKSGLYQLAILFHPTEDEIKAGKTSEVLVPPGDGVTPGAWFISKDDDEAFAIALRKVPEAYMGKFSQVEVAVRPF